MAVQAQYPSNLLFNKNGQQEVDDYSFQLQPAGGLFIDHSSSSSHKVFDHTGIHPRKRGREITATEAAQTGIQLSSILRQRQQQQQQRSHQLIDLSQLQNHNAISTGLRLSFDQQQLQKNQQQNSTSRPSSPLISFSSADFSHQIKQHNQEIDRLLQAHGQQLQRTLAEKRQRHYRALIAAADESTSRRLREKEAVVEKATRRRAELEARVAQLSTEAKVWQAKAREQEAAATTLQAQLQQAVISFGGGGSAVAVDEGMRRCSGVEDAESVYEDPEGATAVSGGGPVCKACRRRAATVVVLPCRHLCLCAGCDEVAQACPLCLQVRNSSVEVFLC